MTPSTEAGHQAGEGQIQEPRVEIYVATVSEHSQLISCALVCPQLHDWVYIEQINPPVPGDSERPAWARELRKIPRTLFAKGESHLLDLARATIAQFIKHAQRDDAAAPIAVLRVGSQEQLMQALGVGFASERARVRRKEANAFWLKCGGKDSARAHALLVALELAVSDASRSYPILVEDIVRLELLLGTKNAQSMRAWLRQNAAGKSKDPRPAKRRGEPVPAPAV